MSLGPIVKQFLPYRGTTAQLEEVADLIKEIVPLVEISVDSERGGFMVDGYISHVEDVRSLLSDRCRPLDQVLYALELVELTPRALTTLSVGADLSKLESVPATTTHLTFVNGIEVSRSLRVTLLKIGVVPEPSTPSPEK